MMPPPAVLLPHREVPLGGVRGSTVYRSLPQRDLPTVGAWCFLDQGVPGSPAGNVLPHPHIGLQTVTWLWDGVIRHRDTIGSDIDVRPGQLNLMTAGHGVAHSEIPQVLGMEFTGTQLWVALPDSARQRSPGFEQHRDLPSIDRDGLSATVLLGEFENLVSPATVYTPITGVDLRLAPGSRVTIELQPDFEYALYPVTGQVQVDDVLVPALTLGYLAPGRRTVVISAPSGFSGLLLGGEPLAEDLVMWWNFVARSHEEVEQARADWEAHSPRFGEIPAHGDRRIPAPPMPAVRLTSRRRRLLR